MIAAISGFTARVVAVATTPQEFGFIAAQEQSLPQLSRLLLEVPIDPSEDIYNIARRIETALAAESAPHWPEYPYDYTFIENNTLYIAYEKPPGVVTPAVVPILGILLGIIILGPIILYLVSPAVREMVNMLIMMGIMLVMMKMMQPMLVPPERRPPKEPSVPLTERLQRRIDGISNLLGKIDAIVSVDVSGAKGQLGSILSHLGGVTSDVKAAPASVKMDVSKDLAKQYTKLSEYEKYLSPSQLEKLHEEQRIVSGLRGMYPQKEKA